MKYAHLIKLTVFSYENEDSDSIVKAFLSFFPFSLEDNKVSLNKINQFLKNFLINLDANQKNQ